MYKLSQGMGKEEKENVVVIDNIVFSITNYNYGYY